MYCIPQSSYVHWVFTSPYWLDSWVFTSPYFLSKIEMSDDSVYESSILSLPGIFPSLRMMIMLSRDLRFYSRKLYSRIYLIGAFTSQYAAILLYQENLSNVTRPSPGWEGSGSKTNWDQLPCSIYSIWRQLTEPNLYTRAYEVGPWEKPGVCLLQVYVANRQSLFYACPLHYFGILQHQYRLLPTPKFPANWQFAYDPTILSAKLHM